MSDNPITQKIIEIADPEKVYLFGQKTTVLGTVKSMDFCLICKNPNKKSLSGQIFLEVESEFPFSIVIYSEEEWSEFCDDEQSFAGRIIDKGTLIYAKNS